MRSPFGLYCLAALAVALTTITLGVEQASASAARQARDMADAPSWASVVEGAPLWIERAVPLRGPSLAADPADPRRIAYCVEGGIRLSLDGGATWATVPTTSVRSVAATAPYPLIPDNDSSPACASVVLDPDHAQSFFAVFHGAAHAAPPIVQLGFQSADGGGTWQLVPPPAGYEVGEFGGFRQEGSWVQALFVGRAPGLDAPPPLDVVQTADGGLTWQSAGLSCPASGACVGWGPGPASYSPMGGPGAQWIVFSTDGGQSWATPAWPSSVDLKAPGPYELVALSATSVALVAGGEADPMLVSRDGGQTWAAVALPALQGSTGIGRSAPGLQVLPDGSLLARPANGPTWQLLVPGATDWCPLSVLPAGLRTDSPRVIGERIWRLEDGGAAEMPPAPASTPLSDLHCGADRG